MQWRAMLLALALGCGRSGFGPLGDDAVPVGDGSVVDEARVLVSERFSGELLALDAFGDPTWVAGDLGQMVGAAIAPDGTVFLARYGEGRITRMSADGSAPHDVLGALPAVHGLWYDIATETLLATNHRGGEVYEVDPATGELQLVASGFGDATMAVRRPGEQTLYVLDRSVGLLRLQPGASPPALVAAFDDPNAILLAPGHRAYVTTNAGLLYEVDLSSGAMELLSAGFGQAAGLCHDPAGNGLLVTTHHRHTLERFDLESGSAATFSVATDTPWDCVTLAAADGDRDGVVSAYFGGHDCDDADPAVGACG